MFKLGTFREKSAGIFVGLVVGDRVLHLSRTASLLMTESQQTAFSGTETMLELLDCWDKNFDAFMTLLERLAVEGLDSPYLRDARFNLGELTVLPPIPRPPKILNAAANYGGHLTEMRNYTSSGLANGAAPFSGDKGKAEPYLFLKASSALCGAFDDIVLPDTEHSVDWEVELALAIGYRGKRISAEKALSHVAGYMTFNDVSCRTTLWRSDRPNFRSDWLMSKSLDTFGPLGPFFVPRQFVSDYTSLQLELCVNGVKMQDGIAGGMIFSAEEQIEYASRFMTLEPGDVFATGTPQGVGQGTGNFLKAGDVIEAEVSGLGRQRCRVINQST